MYRTGACSTTRSKSAVSLRLRCEVGFSFFGWVRVALGIAVFFRFVVYARLFA